MGRPAREFRTERFAGVRPRIAASYGAECGPGLPGGPSTEQASALLVAAMGGLRPQRPHGPEAVDPPAPPRSLVAVLPGSARGAEPDRAGD